MFNVVVEEYEIYAVYKAVVDSRYYVKYKKKK